MSTAVTTEGAMGPGGLSESQIALSTEPLSLPTDTESWPTLIVRPRLL